MIGVYRMSLWCASTIWGGHGGPFASLVESQIHSLIRTHVHESYERH